MFNSGVDYYVSNHEMHFINIYLKLIDKLESHRCNLLHVISKYFEQTIRFQRSRGLHIRTRKGILIDSISFDRCL